MAFFTLDDVGAEQRHGCLNHAFSESAALRESNYREDVLVRFGRQLELDTIYIYGRSMTTEAAAVPAQPSE